MDLVQEKGAKLIIASAEPLGLGAVDVTPKCVRATDEKGEAIEGPATDIVPADGPWTTMLTAMIIAARRRYWHAAGQAIGPPFQAIGPPLHMSFF